MAASWSAIGRSRRSETAIGSPSADTTRAWVTPGVRLAKLAMSQLRSRASALSCGMGVPGAAVACGHGRAVQELSSLARMRTVGDHAAYVGPLRRLEAYCEPRRGSAPGSQ